MQLYLNNSGSRWIDSDKAEMRFVLVMPDGSRRVRSMVCWEALGNFARIVYRVNGRTCYGSPKSADNMETHADGVTGDAALPHVFHTAEKG